ncbi:hypothetical protein Gotur_012996 [Gossypium turneri]
MENQMQGRRLFSRRLIQSEVDRCVFFFPFMYVSEFFEFQEGRFFFMDVIDSLGKVWTVLTKFHTHEVIGNYVSIDWPQFSNEKGLKPNDEITLIARPLQEGGNGGPQHEFKVLVKRKIRLFGQDIWGEVMV